MPTRTEWQTDLLVWAAGQGFRLTAIQERQFLEQVGPGTDMREIRATLEQYQRVKRCPQGRSQCPVCHKCVKVRKNSTLRAHGWRFGRGEHGELIALDTGCSGSWMRVSST